MNDWNLLFHEILIGDPDWSYRGQRVPRRGLRMFLKLKNLYKNNNWV
jgi:hypothetical protein